jgi:hypothetical protein
MQHYQIHRRPALLGLISSVLAACAVQAQQPEGDAGTDPGTAEPSRKSAAVAEANPAQPLTAEMLDAQARVLFARGETEKAIALQRNAVEQAKTTLEKCIENLARYQGKPVNDGPIARKLREIIIPNIVFQEITLEEAVDFLRLRCKELDATEPDPLKKGVNFVIAPLDKVAAEADPFAEPPQVDSRRAGSARFIQSLSLTHVPVGEALKYICQATGTRLEIDDFAVVILNGAK